MMLYKMYHKPQTLAGFTAAIETVPQLAWKYYKNKKKELRRREHLWAQDPKTAYLYALEVLDRPWPEGEPVIAEDPEMAYNYALEVLDGPFPQGEPAIAEDPEMAYNYALEVLDGPFPQGEPAIAEIPDLAYLYALEVLDRSWPEGEPAIAQKPVYWNHYLERFPERRPKTKTKKQS